MDYSSASESIEILDDLLEALCDSLVEKDTPKFGRLLLENSKLTRDHPVESEFIKEILSYVVIYGDNEAIKIFSNFLEAEALKDGDLKKQLIVAVLRNDLKTAKILLKKGGLKVMYETRKKSREFSVVCIVSALTLPKTAGILSIFIKYGLNVRVRNQMDENLYHFLARFPFIGVTEVAQILYDFGLTAVDEATYGTSDTPLLSAIENDNLELAEFLIGKGADVNGSVDTVRFFPLTRAFSQGNEDIVNLLVKNGADVNARDTRTGLTALHEACLISDDNMIMLLFKYDADVNAEDDHGRTPIALLKVDHLPSYAKCMGQMIMRLSKLSVISETNRVFLQTDPTIQSITKKLSEEIDRMKSTVFYAPFNYYSVVGMSNNTKNLSKLTNNEEFVAAFNAGVDSFLSSKDVLKKIFDEAVKARDDFLMIKSFLVSIFKDHLPDLALDVVAENLTVQDIKFE